MTGGDTTVVAGIDIPSTDPVFLTVVGGHVLLGLACTVTGAVAMLSQKRAGRHPRYGTIYFWCLAGAFLAASGLAAVRWAPRLPLVYPWSIVVCGGLSGPPSQTAPLALLGQAAHHRDGSILRLAPDCLLRRQRSESSVLERPSCHGILAGAGGYRNSPYRSCSVVASAGTSVGPALIKGGCHISIILEISLTTLHPSEMIAT
jgi:hypothetical protein